MCSIWNEGILYNEFYDRNDDRGNVYTKEVDGTPTLIHRIE